MNGYIIELRAVVNAGGVIAVGCFISVGAIVNYASMCYDDVHIDCNATVAKTTLVPAETKVKCGEVYDRKSMDVNDLFFNPDE